MPNTVLTPTAVTREILAVAHEKLAFISTIALQYDSSFAQSGGKIGENLKIRLPNRYTVRSGKNLNAQDTTEESVTLALGTQKGVDMIFSGQELTMELQDFSDRIIKPAVNVLASTIESDMLAYVTKKVYQGVGTPGTLPTFLQIGLAKAKLNQKLAPKDGNRHIQMESVDMAGVVNELKGLFHDSKEVAKQYREGRLGRGMGLEWTENERVYAHTVGSDVTTVTINDTLATGDNTITIAGGVLAVGDIFDLGTTCKAVHPETKAVMAHNAQFVVTVKTDSNNYTFEPAMHSTGAKQNVSAIPATSEVVTIIGTASGVYPQHLVYHKDAFAFVTADMELPRGVDFAAREQLDGLSIRVVRQYDVNTDNMPCRIDILYGYEAIRPEWACRVYGDS